VTSEKIDSTSGVDDGDDARGHQAAKLRGRAGLESGAIRTSWLVVHRILRPVRRGARWARRRLRATRKSVRAFRKQPKRARLRKVLGLHALEDLSPAERDRLWGWPRSLGSQHVRDCRVFEDRVALLAIVPPGAVCAEIGILHGDFSKEILEKARPKRLHLIDQARRQVATATARFADEIAAGVVEVHLGDSVATLDALPRGSLDWVYIDGNHSHYGAARDLEAARRVVRLDGLILLNDYTFLGQEMHPYGVIQAVNEFCLEHDYEFVGFALQVRGQHDVALRRRGI
jgi:predicted O-methyltransferase YrrM